jgi:hypothetical protein
VARIDHKRGRLNSDQATDKVFAAMRGYAENNGDWIAYYRFNRAATQYHPVYDEAINGGLQFFPAVRVQCLHVIHIDGPKESTDKGFYYNDSLMATIAFDLFIQAGMTLADIETGNYENDRVLYDRKLFAVTQLSTEGQIQQRDIIVGLEATQLKPDELVNDTMFAAWSLGGPNDLQGTE